MNRATLATANNPTWEQKSDWCCVPHTQLRTIWCNNNTILVTGRQYGCPAWWGGQMPTGVARGSEETHPFASQVVLVSQVEDITQLSSMLPLSSYELHWLSYWSIVAHALEKTTVMKPACAMCTSPPIRLGSAESSSSTAYGCSRSWAGRGFTDESNDDDLERSEYEGDDGERLSVLGLGADKPPHACCGISGADGAHQPAQKG